MRSGKLRHPITLERDEGTTFGDKGQKITKWRTVAHARASIEQIKGEELTLARQVFPTASHKVRCWFVTDVTNATRIRFKDRFFGINSVNNVNEKNKELEFVVSEEL